MYVSQLWRYPVKSMLGESLDEVEVGAAGISGDRMRAVVDSESGVSLSAKRYGELLTCRATTVEGVVRIEFDDGEDFEADSPAAAEKLSSILNRRIRLATAGEGVIRHEFPTEIGTGEGAPFLHEPGLEAYFDRASLHLLTSATLGALGSVNPDSDFAVARFRPNIVVESDTVGFVEDGWVGGTIRVGGVSLVVLDRKPRCVMTTRAQGDLAADPRVLRTVVESNEGNAGVELTARGSGSIRLGDTVEPSG